MQRTAKVCLVDPNQPTKPHALAPNAELSGWLERRREATPLDSPLERRVRLAMHGLAMTLALHKLGACVDRIVQHTAKPSAKRSGAQRGAASTEARVLGPKLARL